MGACRISQQSVKGHHDPFEISPMLRRRTFQRNLEVARSFSFFQLLVVPRPVRRDSAVGNGYALKQRRRFLRLRTGMFLVAAESSSHGSAASSTRITRAALSSISFHHNKWQNCAVIRTEGQCRSHCTSRVLPVSFLLPVWLPSRTIRVTFRLLLEAAF